MSQWFRMYAEFATDPKVQMLSEIYQRRFVMVLCLRCGDESAVLNEHLVAFHLRISVEEAIKTRVELVRRGLIRNDWTLVSPLESCEQRIPVHLWMQLRERIFQRDNYTCSYCGASGVRLECDHILPISKGGSNDEANLTTACVSCNRAKGDKLVSEWVAQNG